jgi:Leucine rich repeat
LAETKRNKNIDPWFGDLDSLQLLDLHGNSLTGEIPTELGQLEYLEVLMLNHNDLQGDIPMELASLDNIGKSPMTAAAELAGVVP